MTTKEESYMLFVHSLKVEIKNFVDVNMPASLEDAILCAQRVDSW